MVLGGMWWCVMVAPNGSETSYILRQVLQTFGGPFSGHGPMFAKAEGVIEEK